MQGYQGLLCVHFQETSLLESFICKSDNSMEKIKGGGGKNLFCVQNSGGCLWVWSSAVAADVPSVVKV